MPGDRVRVSRTTKTAAMIIATVTLICGAAGSLFGAPDAGLAALKRQYWRPVGIPYPKDNPYGRAKEELGRALFFDPILSGARVRSCATMSQSRPVMGRRRAAPDRRKSDAPASAQPDIAQYRLGPEARLG